MKLVFLTGPGISAESGIPTYRDTGGYWKKLDPSIMSINYLREAPTEEIFESRMK